ncbi:hypothetical protein FB451DRAFT_1186354 [Mycena latifolia]|nr:hypothetical protein FB451DRAFT_1186354 [Mycena latifolia]
MLPGNIYLYLLQLLLRKAADSLHKSGFALHNVGGEPQSGRRGEACPVAPRTVTESGAPILEPVHSVPLDFKGRLLRGHALQGLVDAVHGKVVQVRQRFGECAKD